MKDLIHRYIVHDVARSAASLSYYMIFAFFPFLLFFGKLLSLLRISGTTLYEDLAKFVPAGVLSVLRAQIEFNRAGTGWLMTGGMLFVVYFFTRNVNAMFKSIELAMDVRTERKPHIRFLLSLLFTFIIMIITVLSLMIIAVGRNVLTRLSAVYAITARFVGLWHVLRFVALFALLFLMIYALYATCAGRDRKKPPILSGALLAAISCVGVSVCFSLYVESLGRYTVIYGSIGTVIVLLLWFYMDCIILLLGAELNGALSKRAAGARKDAARP